MVPTSGLLNPARTGKGVQEYNTQGLSGQQISLKVRDIISLPNTTVHWQAFLTFYFHPDILPAPIEKRDETAGSLPVNLKKHQIGRAHV